MNRFSIRIITMLLLYLGHYSQSIHSTYGTGCFVNKVTELCSYLSNYENTLYMLYHTLLIFSELYWLSSISMRIPAEHRELERMGKDNMVYLTQRLKVAVQQQRKRKRIWHMVSESTCSKKINNASTTLFTFLVHVHVYKNVLRVHMCTFSFDWPQK